MLCITSLVTSMNQFSPITSLRVSADLDRLVVADPVERVVLDLAVEVASRRGTRCTRLPFLSSKRSSLALSCRPPCCVRLLKPLTVACVRQLPGRHVLVVVDRAGDQRPVGIAVEELHHHLVADPRQREHAVALAGPRLRHAHPARAVLVLLAEPVPVELDLDRGRACRSRSRCPLAPTTIAVCGPAITGSRRHARRAEVDGRSCRRDEVAEEALALAGRFELVDRLVVRELDAVDRRSTIR